MSTRPAGQSHAGQAASQPTLFSLPSRSDAGSLRQTRSLSLSPAHSLPWSVSCAPLSHLHYPADDAHPSRCRSSTTCSAGRRPRTSARTRSSSSSSGPTSSSARPPQARASRTSGASTGSSVRPPSLARSPRLAKLGGRGQAGAGTCCAAGRPPSSPSLAPSRPSPASRRLTEPPPLLASAGRFTPWQIICATLTAVYALRHVADLVGLGCPSFLLPPAPARPLCRPAPARLTDAPSSRVSRTLQRLSPCRASTRAATTARRGSRPRSTSAWRRPCRSGQSGSATSPALCVLPRPPSSSPLPSLARLGHGRRGGSADLLGARLAGQLLAGYYIIYANEADEKVRPARLLLPSSRAPSSPAQRLTRFVYPAPMRRQLRKFRSEATVEMLRTTWEKPLNPYVRLITRP